MLWNLSRYIAQGLCDSAVCWSRSRNLCWGRLGSSALLATAMWWLCIHAHQFSYISNSECGLYHTMVSLQSVIYQKWPFQMLLFNACFLKMLSEGDSIYGGLPDNLDTKLLLIVLNLSFGSFQRAVHLKLTPIALAPQNFPENSASQLACMEEYFNKQLRNILCLGDTVVDLVYCTTHCVVWIHCRNFLQILE